MYEYHAPVIHFPLHVLTAAEYDQRERLSTAAAASALAVLYMVRAWLGGSVTGRCL